MLSHQIWMWFVFVLAVLAVLMTPPVVEGADYDSSLVIALTQEPTNLSPIFLDINAGNWPVFNGLIGLNRNLEPVPDLAVELPEVSADLRQVKVRLRDDVLFHDGRPLTADDVVYTWQSLIDPAVATPVRDRLALGGLIEDVRAVDPQTVVFTLSRPDPAFIEKLYVGIVPRHLLEGKDLNQARFNVSPVGTGPYKFVSWQSGHRLVLEANPDYFRGKPEISRLIYTFVSDESSRAALLRTGAIDFARLTPRLAAGFENDPRFQVVRLPSASISQVKLPNGNPVLSDPKVRRALSMAVDREAMARAVWAGMAEPAYGPIPPGHWAHDPSAYVNYDPEGARALLAEAGWTDENGDGFLEKDGQRLAFTVMYLPHIVEDQQIALALRSDLAKIGVDVTVEGVASPAYLDRLGQDAWLHGIGLPYDPDYVFWSNYHSSFADDGDPNTNRAGMRNPAVDAALEAGRATYDRDQRREAYRKLQQALLDDGSYMFLTQRAVVVVLSAEIEGVQPKLMGSPHAFIRGISWNIAEWSHAR